MPVHLHASQSKLISPTIEAPLHPVDQHDAPAPIKAEQSDHSDQTQQAAAFKLQRMFRRTLAASVYHHMFSKGSVFAKSNLPYTPQPTKLHPESLAHLEKISQQSLKSIQNAVGTLSPAEKNLLIQINQSPWFFRHQTDAHIEKGTDNEAKKLVIKSNHSLARDKSLAKTNTLNFDLRALSNNDFVFFAVEMTDRPQKQNHLLSTTHNGYDFGAFAYLIPETDQRVRQGYLTIADHLFSFMSPAGAGPEASKWKKTNPDASAHFSRNKFQDEALGMTPMFRARDMKKGVGLYLIKNLRTTSDGDFRKKVLNARANDPLLHNAIQLIMQPEFHIPRTLATHNYLKITHRAPEFKDLLAAGNTFEANKLPLKKDEGIELLEIAIHDLNKKSIDYLTHRLEFNVDDMNQMTDAPYFLSRFGSTPSIVQPFLDKNLIDVNKPFETNNTGELMLDNCIKYDNKPLALVLMAHGANPELLSPNHQIKLQHLINS